MPVLWDRWILLHGLREQATCSPEVEVGDPEISLASMASVPSLFITRYIIPTVGFITEHSKMNKIYQMFNS